jgi:transcriptional regulator with XRE-family HTH domain
MRTFSLAFGVCTVGACRVSIGVTGRTELTVAPGDSPAAARRRLRLALRTAREKRELTQGQVAQALEWSLSKVNRIENGDVTVSNTDLRALLTLYGVEPGPTSERMAEDARTSRRRGWWDESRYRDYLTPAMHQLVQFEAEASVIRVFQPTLVPGPLQTRAYAEAIFEFTGYDFSPLERRTRIEVRERRRDQMLGRVDPPGYLVVLDESVLHREMGGAKVMAGQLQQLLAFTRYPHIVLRVVPFAAAASLATLGMFTILDLGDEENAVLYRESSITDEINHSVDVIGRHRKGFDRLWDSCLSEQASARQIEARSAALLASLDRAASS